MLLVGQIRKASVTSPFLTPLPLDPDQNITVIYNKGDSDKNNVIFQDFGIDSGTSDGFKSGVTYYLRFSVRRYPSDPGGHQYGDYDTVNFNLLLCREQGDPTTGEHGASERLQTVEKNLVITPYVKNTNSPWQQFTLVFTPTESARYLWFRVNRIGYDYIYASEDPSRGMGRAVFRYYGVNQSKNTVEFSNIDNKEITVEIEVDAKTEYYNRVSDALDAAGIPDKNEIMEIIDVSLKNPEDLSKDDIGLFWKGDKDYTTEHISVTGEFSRVENIIHQANIVQIGIQSRPGSLFVVNHEPIYLGRSGVYEVNNGTKITSVGVVAPNGSDKSNIQEFILDYAYTEEE